MENSNKIVIIILGIICTLFTIYFNFFRQIKEDFIVGILFVIYTASIFIVNDFRRKDKLEDFLRAVEHLRKYIIPAFALITALLIGLIYKSNQNLFSTVLIWYVLLFVLIDLIIWIPTFNILKDNINSIFARIYFVLATFIFGWLSSSLTARIGVETWIKGLEELVVDNVLFYYLSLIEVSVGIILIWYFFKYKK